MQNLGRAKQNLDYYILKLTLLNYILILERGQYRIKWEDYFVRQTVNEIKNYEQTED